MNIDRNCHQTVQNEKNLRLINKVQKLPIVPKVYLYIFFMAIVGTVMGELKYRVEATNCLANDDCWIVEPTQRRAKELTLGAGAGIFAATLIAIPALLAEN